MSDQMEQQLSMTLMSKDTQWKPRSLEKEDKLGS